MEKTSADDAALAHEARALVDAAAASGGLSGAVRIERDGAVIFAAAAGMAARAWQVPNTADTRFRVASISKMFTAVAVLRLVERGALRLDESVVDRLELAGTRLPRAATVRHLLTMTSGIADWFDESGDWQTEWAALCRRQPIYLLRQNADYLPLFAQSEPLGPVGETHRYNGAGYILLGMLIERLAGENYFDFVRREVFTHAGMEQTDFVALDDPVEGVAEGYTAANAEEEAPVRWKRNIYSTTPAAAADGGATSTCADLCHFSRALRGGVLLAPELTSEMLRPQVPERAEPLRGYDSMYGFGAFFLVRAGQVARWGHTGEEDGVSGRFYHYPQEGIDLAILGNESWCAGSLSWELHERIVGV